MNKLRYLNPRRLWSLVALAIFISSCSIKTQPGTPMVFIPEGYFNLRDIRLQDGKLSETYAVWLDDYYIDTYEVTNSAYQLCVTAEVCPSPPEDPQLNEYSKKKYYDDLAYKTYPVIHINWDDAKTFCEWRGARLPTQAEWVKAARGTDLRVYPWGNEEPTCEYANYGELRGVCSPSPGLAPVGSRPDGVSPYGVYDLVGNVEEWTADCYGDLADFMSDDARNPVAPETPGCRRVIHGGSILVLDLVYLKIDARTSRNPERASFTTGFRCVETR